jgi:dUTP pyrophosphatase
MSDPVCDLGAAKAIVGHRKYFWIDKNLECDGPCGKMTRKQKAAIITQLAEGLDRFGFTVDVEYDWANCALVIRLIRISDNAIVHTDILTGDSSNLALPSPHQVAVDLFKPLSTLPHRQHPGDAGYDLYANETLTINVGAIKLVRCGFRMAIPRGVVGFICPRSGMALKRGVTVLNGPGVIDPGFEDEVGVVLINLGDRHFDIAVGDRIAQIVFVETAAVEVVAGRVGVEAVSTTRRGGFGSSGGFGEAAK